MLWLLSVVDTNTGSYGPDSWVVIPVLLIWSPAPGAHAQLVHCYVDSVQASPDRPTFSLSDEIYVAKYSQDLMGNGNLYPLIHPLLLSWQEDGYSYNIVYNTVLHPIMLPI